MRSFYVKMYLFKIIILLFRFIAKISCVTYHKVLRQKQRYIYLS